MVPQHNDNAIITNSLVKIYAFAAKSSRLDEHGIPPQKRLFIKFFLSQKTKRLTYFSHLKQTPTTGTHEELSRAKGLLHQPVTTR